MSEHTVSPPITTSGTEERLITLLDRFFVDVEDLVVIIRSRRDVGLKKYGVSVDDNPLPLKDWITHALEEKLDAAVYLRRMLDLEPRPDYVVIWTTMLYETLTAAVCLFRRLQAFD
jgi:hypothetical protein